MDANEFTARTEQMKTRLYRMAFLYLGSESMAVDEAVFSGFKAFKKLRSPEYFETWLTRILINECRKELRRGKREMPADPLPESAAEDFDSLPLKEAILRLPQELKEVVILRYFSDLTLEKTAESLSLPRGTVATRQNRALTLLRLELSEEE